LWDNILIPWNIIIINLTLCFGLTVKAHIHEPKTANSFEFQGYLQQNIEYSYILYKDKLFGTHKIIKPENLHF
jgi:hypothetical protein